MKFAQKQILCSLSLITFLFILQGCETKQLNLAAQEQHFICKSLIDGYLKSQSLGQYQFDQVHPTLEHSSPQRDYTYKVTSDSQIKFNYPRQNNLQFLCNQTSAQKFQVELRNLTQHTQYQVISLELPPNNEIQQLTAYALNHP